MPFGSDGLFRLWDLSSGQWVVSPINPGNQSFNWAGNLGQAVEYAAAHAGPFALERLDSLDSTISFAELPQNLWHIWEVNRGDWQYDGRHALGDLQGYIRFGSPAGSSWPLSNRPPGPFFLMRA